MTEPRRRRAAIAGTFYPADPTVLQATVKGFIDAAAPLDGPPPKAVVAPHAGLIYSGPIAASAYARLKAASGRLRRVVLLGPAHRVWFQGVATSSAQAFRTPLGDVPLDRSAIAELLEMDGVIESDEAHAQEHDA